MILALEVLVIAKVFLRWATVHSVTTWVHLAELIKVGSKWRRSTFSLMVTHTSLIRFEERHGIVLATSSATALILHELLIASTAKHVSIHIRFMSVASLVSTSLLK